MSAASPELRRRGGWFRRAVKISIVVVVALVLLRIALPFIGFEVAKRVLAARGLELGWSGLDLSVLAGRAEVMDVTLTRSGARAGSGTEPKEPDVRLAFAEIDLRVSALLSGRLVVENLEVDGLEAVLDRDADGVFALLRGFGSEAADADAIPPPAESPGAPPSIDLRLPVEIERLRVQPLRVTLNDASLTPPLRLALEVTVRGDHLGSDEHEGRLEIRARSKELLDVFALDATMRGDADSLDASVAVAGNGLRFAPLAPYLRAVGAEPVASDASIRATVVFAARTTGEATTSASATISVTDVALAADGIDAAALGSLDVKVNFDRGADGNALRVDLVDAAGLRARAGRAENGRLLFAGLALGPAPAPDHDVRQPPRAPAEPASTPLAWSLGRLAIRDAEAEFLDRSVDGSEPIVVRLESLVAGPIDPLAAADPTTLTRIEAELRAPGALESLRLEGTAHLFGARRSAELALSGDGVTARSLVPHLRSIGLEPVLESGALRLSLSAVAETDAAGRTVASVRVEPIEFRDTADREWVSFARVAVAGAEWGPRGEPIRVGEVVVSGPSLPILRDAEGSFHALGFKTVAASGRPSTTPPGADVAAVEDAAPPTPSAGPPLDFEIGRVEWDAGAITYSDETFDPPLRLRSGKTRLEVEGLASRGEPARLSLHAELPDVVEAISLDARLSLGIDSRSISCDGTLVAAGISAAAARPLLARAGVDAATLDGSLRARFEASVAARDFGVTAITAALSDVEYRDGNEVVLSLESLRLRDSLTGEAAGEGERERENRQGVAIGAIEIVKPAVRLARDADGALRVGTVRLVPVPSAAAAAAPASSGESARAPATPSSNSIVSIESISLESASVAWTDVARGGAPIVIDATLDGTVEALVLGGARDGTERRSTAVALVLSSPGVADSLTLRGSVRLAPDDLEARFRIEGSGLRPGPLAAYLPPGLTTSITDGRLRADLVAGARPAADGAGGDDLRFEVTSLDWRDGSAPDASLFGFERLALRAPRVDPRAGGAVLVDEIALTGLEAGVRLHESGAMTVAGFRVEPAPEPAIAPETPSALDNASLVPTPVPAPAPVAAAAGAAGAATGFRALDPLPLVRVGSIDVGAARLVLDADGREPGAEPIVASIRCVTDGPVTLLAPEPDDDPAPIVLRVEGSAVPALRELRVDLSLEPFADHPAASFDVRASGMSGHGLVQLLPSLASRIDPSGLADGVLLAKGSAAIVFPRRGPLDFEFSGGFGAEVEVSAFEIRATPDGKVEAGIDEVEVIVQRVTPKSGDVHVRSVRIETPRGSVSLEPDGIRVMGLLLKTVVAAAEPAPPPTPVEPTVDPGAPRKPELRIDSIQVSGVDFTFTDAITDPPLVIPIDDLGADVRGYSTRAAETRRPLSFSFSASPGMSAFPEGPRRAFDEIALSGRVIPGPEPVGFAQLNVSALDLRALAAEAARSGVTIGGGTLDARASLRFKGSAGSSMESRLVFDSLSLTESSDGPITRFLKLPTSLDTVLFLLRDSNERHQFNFDFSVPPGGIGGGALLRHAIAKLSETIAKAVANSPFRVTGAMTNFLGITGGEKEDKGPAIEIEFAPGDSALRPDQVARLRQAIERLDDDGELTLVLRHDVGAEDLSVAEARANPPIETAREIATRLRRDRAAFAREQAEAAALARTLFAAGRRDEAEALAASIRALEERSGECEGALEEVLSLLSPRADRRRPQRTRAACVDLGATRLAAVREALLGSGVSEIEERITVRPARGGPVSESGPGKVTLIETRRPSEPGLWDEIVGTVMFWTWI